MCDHDDHFQFARVNQDELRSRKKCAARAVQYMSKGLCVIVDRCNFDSSQRQVWYDLAASGGTDGDKNKDVSRPAYPVDCVVLDVPVSICIQRCQLRSSHETVQPNDAERIVNMVKQQWETPRLQEGRAQDTKKGKGNRVQQSSSLRKIQVVKSSEELNKTLAWYLNEGRQF